MASACRETSGLINLHHLATLSLNGTAAPDSQSGWQAVGSIPIRVAGLPRQTNIQHRGSSVVERPWTANPDGWPLVRIQLTVLDQNIDMRQEIEATISCLNALNALPEEELDHLPELEAAVAAFYKKVRKRRRRQSGQRRKSQDRNVVKTIAVQRQARVNQVDLTPPGVATPVDYALAHKKSNMLFLQSPLSSRSRAIPLVVPSVRRSKCAKANADGGPFGVHRGRNGRSDQDRVSNRLVVAAMRRDGARHDAFRCRRRNAFRGVARIRIIRRST